MALFYIEHALDIELNDESVDQIVLAGTHLNVCAIQQRLKNHNAASESAKSAIALVYEAMGLRENL